jgi:hypothetical protein
MKNKLLFTLAVLLLSNLTFGQYNSKGADEKSRFKPGAGWYFTGVRPAILERVRKYDRLIFDISYNDWVGDLESFKTEPASIGFGINAMFDKPLTKGNTISLGYGLGYKRYQIRYSGYFISPPGQDFTFYSQAQNFRNSRLSINEFYFPLEVRFRKESWKHLKLHLGGKIGYAFEPHQKSKNIVNSKKIVVKDYRFNDFNPLQYGVHVRMGLRSLALFGEYNFSKVFKKSASPKISLFRLGISISLF